MLSNGASSSGTCKVYHLTWSEFGSSLTRVAQNLRKHDDLTDITVCAGGKIFPAHKLILSAASPLLTDLLKSTKCQHPILMLAGITDSDFELLLDFLYHGEVNIDSEKLPSLLQAAEILDIQALSPSALVLNSSHEQFDESANLSPDAGFSKSIASSNTIVSNKPRVDEVDLQPSMPKRKRCNSPIESTESCLVENVKEQSFAVKNIEDKSAHKPLTRSIPKVVLPAKMSEMGNQQGKK